jgi:hypothetical protein
MCPGERLDVEASLCVAPKAKAKPQLLDIFLGGVLL